MGKTKSFSVKNRDLGREIQRAERAEGYLIMISRKSGGVIRHTYFTRTFPREDISTALKEHEKLLKKEMVSRPTESKKIPKIEGQKRLPPEYRGKRLPPEYRGI